MYRKLHPRLLNLNTIIRFILQTSTIEIYRKYFRFPGGFQTGFSPLSTKSQGDKNNEISFADGNVFLKKKITRRMISYDYELFAMLEIPISNPNCKKKKKIV